MPRDRAFRDRPLLQLQVQPADGRKPHCSRRPTAGALRHAVGGGDAAREIHCAAGDRLGFDAGRLIHHPGERRQRKEEIAAAANAAIPPYSGGAAGHGTETDLPAARVLGLPPRPRRGDVLWQLAPDGARGLPARTRRQHGGRGLRRLRGGDTVLPADPAQARLLPPTSGPRSAKTCRGSSPRPCWWPSPRPSSTPRLP